MRLVVVFYSTNYQQLLQTAFWFPFVGAAIVVLLADVSNGQKSGWLVGGKSDERRPGDAAWPHSLTCPRTVSFGALSVQSIPDRFTPENDNFGS